MHTRFLPTSHSGLLPLTLNVLGENNAAAACAFVVRSSQSFLFEPLPDDRYELHFDSEQVREEVRRLLNGETLPETNPPGWEAHVRGGAEIVPAWELHVKRGVRWKLVAATPEQAVKDMAAYIVQCEGEIEPMDAPFRPQEQWNPQRVPVAWIG